MNTDWTSLLSTTVSSIASSGSPIAAECNDKDDALKFDLENALALLFLDVFSLSLHLEAPNKAEVFAFESTLAWRLFGKLLVSLSITSVSGKGIALDLVVEGMLFLGFFELFTCDIERCDALFERAYDVLLPLTIIT